VPGELAAGHAAGFGKGGAGSRLVAHGVTVTVAVMNGWIVHR
jgi:hypothetical protein